MGARSTEGSIFLPRIDTRSEEHTSELQSPCNLGWRLLLGKKNTAFEAKLAAFVRVPRATDALADRLHRLSRNVFGAGARDGVVQPTKAGLRVAFHVLHSIL